MFCTPSVFSSKQLKHFPQNSIIMAYLYVLWARKQFLSSLLKTTEWKLKEMRKNCMLVKHSKLWRERSIAFRPYFRHIMLIFTNVMISSIHMRNSQHLNIIKLITMCWKHIKISIMWHHEMWYSTEINVAPSECLIIQLCIISWTPPSTKRNLHLLHSTRPPEKNRVPSKENCKPLSTISTQAHKGHWNSKISPPFTNYEHSQPTVSFWIFKAWFSQCCLDSKQFFPLLFHIPTDLSEVWQL